MTIESDIVLNETPRSSGRQLYHYTLSIHLNDILKAGYIKTRSCFFSTVNTPAIWFTTNPDKEPTIWKRSYTTYPFVPIQFKLSESATKYNLVKVISWPEYCASGGYRNTFLDDANIEAGYIANDLHAANMAGSDPAREWFMCLSNIELYYFDSPKVFHKGNWVDISHIEAAISEAEKTQIKDKSFADAK